MKQTEKIKIIYTTDIHGHALPIIYGTNESADLGLATYATIAKQNQQANDNIILIDNGDLIQGTPLMTHYVKEYAHTENPMIGILNKIGVHAAIIGNHEFNFGQEILQSAIQESNFPWLAANIINKKTDEPFFGKPYLIKTFKSGIKVAIVGVTTHYIPYWEASEHIKGIEFRDAFSTLKKWVNNIQNKEKPDVLIAAYHGGIERDLNTGEPTESLTGENQGYQMAEEIAGIDILLTGHQHRELTGMIHNCLLIQAGKHGTTYGAIDIELESNNNVWHIINKSAEVRDLTGVQADSEILTYLEDLESSTQKWLDEPIGHIDGDMTIVDPFTARTKKHPFIEFIQNVQMDASGVDISVTALLSNESKGFSSTVKMRDIVSNYIYPNTLTVLGLSGKDIIAALEKTATYFIKNEDGELHVNPTYITPKPQHYNYDMWEGISYTINVDNPFGSRIENVLYRGNPLNEEETYHVVMNNYRASGGGNYHMFKDKPVVKDIQIDMVDLIRRYFEKHKTVKATITNNFFVK